MADEQIAREIKRLKRAQELRQSVENDAHFRVDNLMGPGSLYSQWYNRFRYPATANTYDREMTADPVGSGGWAWAVAPGAIPGSGYDVTSFPHWLYVYLLGAGAGQADLRCTNPGLLPRYKRLIIETIPASANFGFTFRSVSNPGNDYIEWLLTATQAQAWVCSGGVRANIGNYTLTPWMFPVWLEISNFPGGNFLTWGMGQCWGPGAWYPGTSAALNQQAANVQYIQLLFNQSAAAGIFERYNVDYVRFAAA